MSQLIVTKNKSGGVSIGYPTEEALSLYTINELALKDTPTGFPFWIVDGENIPIDHTFFDSWELDIESLGDPDGYGMDYKDWEKEYKKL